jgi:type III pantothenate kinase
MTKFLVIDVGNSQTKWSIATKRSLGKIHETSSEAKNIRCCFRRTRGVDAAVISSVVPSLNPVLRKILSQSGVRRIRFVSGKTDLGIGVRYPRPQTIGADRLANAVAACHFFGAPSVVIDFGTAVTFDIISSKREYIGGIICPGLRSMTSYLHEKTALLPRITLKEPRRMVGKSTVEAMRIGAIIGFRGLIIELLARLKNELRVHKLPVIATGGTSRLIAKKVPAITAVRPKLTLEGLRLIGLRLLIIENRSR